MSTITWNSGPAFSQTLPPIIDFTLDGAAMNSQNFGGKDNNARARSSGRVKSDGSISLKYTTKSGAGNEAANKFKDLRVHWRDEQENEVTIVLNMGTVTVTLVCIVDDLSGTFVGGEAVSAVIATLSYSLISEAWS